MNLDIGFVYVLTNESMPGIVKIGETGRLAEDRSHELFNTSVPTPFKVVFRIATSRRKEVEREAHRLLAEHRVNSRREFFEVSVERAIASVRRAVIDCGGIHAWDSDETIKIKEEDRVYLALEAGQLFALISYPDIITKDPIISAFWQAHSDCDQLELYCVDSTDKVSAYSRLDPDSGVDPVPFLNREETVINGKINGKEALVSGQRLVWIPAMGQEAQPKRVIFEASSPVQVVSRTWSPKVDGHGLPLLLNDFLYGSLWPEAIKAIRDTFNLGLPRTWAPLEDGESESGMLVKNPQPSEYWLKQLAPKAKKKNRRKIN